MFVDLCTFHDPAHFGKNHIDLWPVFSSNWVRNDAWRSASRWKVTVFAVVTNLRHALYASRVERQPWPVPIWSKWLLTNVFVLLCFQKSKNGKYMYFVLDQKQHIAQRHVFCTWNQITESWTCVNNVCPWEALIPLAIEVGHRGDIHRWSGTSTAIFINFTLSTGGSRWNLRLFDSKIHLPNPPPRKKQTSNQTLDKMVVEVWNELKKAKQRWKSHETNWMNCFKIHSNTLYFTVRSRIFYSEWNIDKSGFDDRMCSKFYIKLLDFCIFVELSKFFI